MTNKSITMNTPEVRTSYVNVFQKKPVYNQPKRKEFTVTGILSKSDDAHKEWVKDFRKTCFDMMVENFPYLDKEELKKWVMGKPNQLIQDKDVQNFPLTDGDVYNKRKEGKYPELVGSYSFRPKSADTMNKDTGEVEKEAIPPAVVDRNVNAILDTTQVYSGCYAIMNINLYTYGGKDMATGKNTGIPAGIGIGLKAFQKTKDGEPLGSSGPVDAKSVFEALPATTTEDDYSADVGDSADEGFFDEE